MRPDRSEYSSYFSRYIDLVQGDVIVTLETDLDRSLEFYSGIAEEHGGFRYAEGKWSIKEVLGHVMDTERVFAYRALRFGRSDPAVLTSMDQDVMMTGATFNSTSLRALCEEFAVVRHSTLHLFRNFQPDAWSRVGSTGENHMSVRALAFIIAGHDIHHRDVVRSRYLPALRGAGS